MSFVNFIQNTEQLTTKELILSVLTKKWPLSAKEIYSRVSKHSKKEITYQAIHKVLTELESQKILEKKGRNYSLNIEWLEKQINELSQVKQKYTGKVREIIVNKHSSTPQIYKFETLSDASIGIAELFASKQLCDNDNEPLMGMFQYGWFTLNFSFKDLALVRRVVKSNPIIYAFIQNRTAFGQWICKQYHKVGMNCVILKESANLTEDIMSKGDYIVEASFTEEARKNLEAEYNKVKNIEGLFKKFALRNEPKIEVTLKITKNPQLARIVRNEFKTIYKNATKKK
jgi:hypothetical protein